MLEQDDKIMPKEVEAKPFERKSDKLNVKVSLLERQL